MPEVPKVEKMLIPDFYTIQKTETADGTGLVLICNLDAK